MEALNVIYVVFMVLFLFGLTIFAHEFGHFVAARIAGLVVEVFSIGFGPPVWKRRIGGVTYKIGCLPVGGYVALPQMESGVERQPDNDEPNSPGAKKTDSLSSVPLPAAPPVAKIGVALAGGLGNLALAIILAWIVYIVGKPSEPAERSARVGYVATNSAAYAAGIRMGDEVLEVNGRKVSNWLEVVRAALGSDTVRLFVRTATGERLFEISTSRNTFGIRALDGLEPVSLCRVGAVVGGSPAEEAGICMGDTILSFDGVETLSFSHLSMLIRDRPDRPASVVLVRNRQTINISVTPRFDPAVGYAIIGVRWDPRAVEYDRRVHIPPARQIVDHASAIFELLARLASPKHTLETSRGLAGPVFILYYFAEFVRQGLPLALWFTVFINVNLAIVNLLPIPVLDGGHILFAFWELVSRRRVHPMVMQWTTNIFAGLLILAMILLTGRDTLRLGADRLLRQIADRLSISNNNTQSEPVAKERP